MTQIRVRHIAFGLAFVAPLALLALVAWSIFMARPTADLFDPPVTPMSLTGRFSTAIVNALGPDFAGLDMTGARQYRGAMQSDGQYLVPVANFPAIPDGLSNRPSDFEIEYAPGPFVDEIALVEGFRTLETFSSDPFFTLTLFINPDNSGYILGRDL